MSNEPMAPELIEANKAKLEAEAVKALAEAEAARTLAERNRAEALKHDAERVSLEQSNEVNAFTVLKNREMWELERTSDFHHRVCRFGGAVTTSSVEQALKTLGAFHRLDPKCPITFTINSPGGEVVSGMELFDYLLFLRRAGHKVTTLATGYAASMGGILLQAGDVRAMTPNAQVLIHKISFGAQGSTDNIMDAVERVNKLHERVIGLFTERAHAAHEANPDVCTAPLSAEDFAKEWNRRDWWLNSDECLKHGFVDEVR